MRPATARGPGTLVDDLERVVANLGLENPAVVGHSLGGGVAALWAGRHPECPAAVDLDGIRGVETTPENYPGLDPAVARTQLAELTASFEAQATAMAVPLSEQHLDAMREQHRQLGGEPAIEMFERNLVTIDDATFVRPNAGTVATFRTGQHELDMFDVFAKAQCPLLICAATTNLPDTERFAELLEAQRRGVERDLDKVEHANTLLRVERIPASHGMVHERPDLLAELIRKFLD